MSAAFGRCETQAFADSGRCGQCLHARMNDGRVRPLSGHLPYLPGIQLVSGLEAHGEALLAKAVKLDIGASSQSVSTRPIPPADNSRG
jgi:hypothetical protein